jgi:cation:H+ antiporter
VTLPLGAWAVVFAVAACASLAASGVLVRRIEMFAARLGVTEAILGLVSALAANSPEITSAVTALAQGQRDIGIGVVLGSNVFNLAALLGVGALVAGAIRLHRAATVLTGSVGAWVALWALAVIGAGFDPRHALFAVLVVLVPYVVVAATPRILHRLPLPPRWSGMIRVALFEEETELAEMVRPARGTWRDAVVGGVTLVVVVVASAVMERSAATVGDALHIPTIVIGGLVLAAVTSLPNAVAAVYLAGRGRGAAVLSETMNSNTLNVVIGLLVPASLIGLGSAAAGGAVIAAAFAAGLTLVALTLAYVGRGLTRWSGALLVVGYVGFVAAVVTA